MTQMIDYDRFRSSNDAVTLYNLFKKQTHQLMDETQNDVVDFEKVLPKQGNTDADMVKHYFYMSVLYSFEAYDRQVYRLGPNLFQMFMKTKLPKLSLDDVKPPYPCLYVAFPPAVDITIDSRYGPLQAHGCYLFDSRDPENMMKITVKQDGGDVLLNEINFVVAFHNVVNPSIDGDFIRVFSLEPGERDLENYIKELAKREHYPEDHQKAYPQVARVALNLVFYLNSANREIGVVRRPDETRIKQLEKELRTTRSSRTRLIEKLTTKLDKAKHQVVITSLAPSLEGNKDLTRSLSTPTGRTVREHWVHGFYNYYWCNNKDEKGVVIPGKHVESRWIEPYKRGSDAGKVVRQHYEVLDVAKGNEKAS